MENATKALIIAGSVLIAIGLIGVGMRIFNSTSETTDTVETTMIATAVTMFNNKFTPYIGPINQRVKKVEDAKALLNVLLSHNSTSDRKVIVTVKYDHTLTGQPTTYCNKTTDPQVIGNALSRINQDIAPGHPTYIMVTTGYSDKWGNGYDSDGYIKYILICDRTSAYDVIN